jgi:hypothetical protein
MVKICIQPKAKPNYGRVEWLSGQHLGFYGMCVTLVLGMRALSLLSIRKLDSLVSGKKGWRGTHLSRKPSLLMLFFSIHIE